MDRHVISNFLVEHPHKGAEAFDVSAGTLQQTLGVSPEQRDGLFIIEVASLCRALEVKATGGSAGEVVQWSDDIYKICTGPLDAYDKDALIKETCPDWQARVSEFLIAYSEFIDSYRKIIEMEQQRFGDTLLLATKFIAVTQWVRFVEELIPGWTALSTGADATAVCEAASESAAQWMHAVVESKKAGAEVH